jgi:hypothetical protein
MTMSKNVPFERNTSREGMKPKGETLEWWSLSTPVGGLHVYNRNETGWHWKINTIGTISDNKTYPDKDAAMTACRIEYRQILRRTMREIGVSA